MISRTIAPFSLSIAASLAVIGCASANNTPLAAASEKPDMSEPASTASADKRISVTGTVRFIEINGGFWGIVGDDGKHYDPMDLDPQLQEDGLRVRFEAVPETDMMSSRMWGAMIRLIHIETVKPD